MKVTIEANADYWWIEKRDRGVAVMVRFKGKDPEGKEYEFKKEPTFKTLDEAVAFIKEQLEGPTT